MTIFKILLLALLSAAVVRAEETKIPAITAIPAMAYQHLTLPNGLNIYSVEDHTSPTIAIQVWYHVGAKDDPAGRSGFAHLFEHIMFKGNKDMKPEMMDRLTEDIGGANNAYTADDVTVFYETVPSNYLEPILWAEGERMASLKVDAGNFRSERFVVEQEYRQRVLADPYGEFSEEILKKSFAQHPYKRPPIGNMHDLNAATLNDVVNFHATFYRPDNATMVVVGDFDPAQFNKWVAKYFGAIPTPSAAIPRVTTKEPPRTSSQRFDLTDAKIPLPAIAITYLAPPRSSNDASVFQVVEQIMGGGDSSRLYQSLVYRQQLAESVSSNADLRQDLGLFAITSVLASGKTTQQGEEALLAEINKLKDEPVSAGELSKAKNEILTQKLKERETFEGKAAALADAVVLLGDPARVNTDLAKVQAVTAADVQRVMRKYITDTNRVVITDMAKPDAPANTPAPEATK
ncbi:MAG: pitrilysin family protein [Chthoniobacteraceae bacterium]